MLVPGEHHQKLGQSLFIISYCHVYYLDYYGSVFSLSLSLSFFIKDLQIDSLGPVGVLVYLHFVRGGKKDSVIKNLCFYSNEMNSKSRGKKC